jgi:hypothetical protein
VFFYPGFWLSLRNLKEAAFTNSATNHELELLQSDIEATTTRVREPFLFFKIK